MLFNVVTFVYDFYFSKEPIRKITMFLRALKPCFQPFSFLAFFKDLLKTTKGIVIAVTTGNITKHVSVYIPIV